MSVELAVQVALRSRFVTTPEITQLVPASNIVDRASNPPLNPSIVLGEFQTTDDGDSIKRNRLRVYATVHVWKREESLSGIRSICWAIRSAIRPGRFDLGANFHCADCYVSSTRHLRDPDGVTSHGVVTIEMLVKVLA